MRWLKLVRLDTVNDYQYVSVTISYSGTYRILMESARRTYGMVVDVSEFEKVGAANEWDFWHKNNEHFPCGIALIIYILRYFSF